MSIPLVCGARELLAREETQPTLRSLLAPKQEAPGVARGIL